MGQGLSGSSKLIIAARGYSKEQSQIQADPIFGPYGVGKFLTLPACAMSGERPPANNLKGMNRI
jgi:hypothetical protein